MDNTKVPAECREQTNARVQGRLEILCQRAGELEALIDELTGEKDEGKAGQSNVEPFAGFWDSLSERLDSVSDRIQKSTERIRGMIL